MDVPCFFAAAWWSGSDELLRWLAGVAGVLLIIEFFKSVIRVGVLNQRYRDPLASGVGRLLLDSFRLRIRLVPGGRLKKNEIMVWYWPCALIAITATWFFLVTFGFALLNWAFRADATFISAIVSSGSALSTLGFSTPTSLAGEILAILEGAIGLFLIVYLFTFLPGFMSLLHKRGMQVAWVYARTGGRPAGAALLGWFFRSDRSKDLDAVCESWEGFLRDFSQSRSFLPILCIVRPLDLTQSWVCAFGAFMDALALLISSVNRWNETACICFECGVVAIRNARESMTGIPIAPGENPFPARVSEEDFARALDLLERGGAPLKADRKASMEEFLKLRAAYENELAWLAAALSDPLPDWRKQENG